MRLLDPDVWHEVLDTVRSNRLRTLLTGFSVAWGVYILIVLLGSGRGLANGVEHQFRDDAVNSLWVRSGMTSLPHRGLAPGREVQFTNEDVAEVRRAVPGVEHLTARFYVRGEVTMSYKGETGSFDIRSVHPGHQFLEQTIITEGRFLNDLDISGYRKVAVIGDLVRDALFGREPPLGKYVNINGIAFKVVGVFRDEGGEGERQKVYLPISTAQRTFNGGNRVAQFMLTTGDASVEDSRRMADGIKEMLARRHRFAEADPRAVFIGNNLESFRRFLDLMDGIRGFVWAIGLGTLLAGVVSVSNIMLISVRERTKEIGVRKALGATPGSIVGLVLQEAMLLTAAAGWTGLMLGLGTLELADRWLPDSGFFRRPGVDVAVAVQATAVLVAAGALAGLVPARRAARIRPIEALRDE